MRAGQGETCVDRPVNVLLPFALDWMQWRDFDLEAPELYLSQDREEVIKQGEQYAATCMR